jgi:hypothetical protein
MTIKEGHDIAWDVGFLGDLEGKEHTHFPKHRLYFDCGNQQNQRRSNVIRESRFYYCLTFFLVKLVCKTSLTTSYSMKMAKSFALFFNNFCF